MADIVKTYKEHHPALRFIGKKYTDEDRVDGLFGAKWGEWFENKWFDIIEKLGAPGGLDKGHIGYMTHGEDGKFQYWIGLFTPDETQIPEGFDFLDFEAGHIGVCHVYGIEPDVYCKECMCSDKLNADGYKIKPFGCFERYNYPRFCEPDDKGNIILDVCFFVE
ncbi:MAG: GyrI-like domain-containing protein [Oscillospiraceae bacterium]|nr:GyrI-like domain-containing protein [Oscillospiraceae bacterium]